MTTQQRAGPGLLMNGLGFTSNFIMAMPCHDASGPDPGNLGQCTLTFSLGCLKCSSCSLLQVSSAVFSAQQHICLACYMLLPIEKRLKLGLWNFHHIVAPSL